MIYFILLLNINAYFLCKFKKFDVNPAKKIEEHPQWDFTDEEEDKNGNDIDEEYATESESE